jgi:hypothetical protein
MFYWEREGRESFEALALFGGLLAISLVRPSVFSGNPDLAETRLTILPANERSRLCAYQCPGIGDSGLYRRS